MEKFHDDALREIWRHLVCVADRDDAADVCKKWRAAIAESKSNPPLPRQLPWLLLPSADSTQACCLFCGTSNNYCAIRHKVVPMHGSRYFGSYNGSWLFLARDQIRGHALVNVRAPCLNGKVRYLNLPEALAPSVYHGQYGQRNIVMLAATLSSPPDDMKCIGAGIVMEWQLIPGQRQVAFWRMGDAFAMIVDADVICQPALEAEDVLYQDGAFRVLTEGGHIRVYTPVFNQSRNLDSISTSVCFFQGMGQHNQRVRARYLVESRGLLLMVVRYGCRYVSHLGTTDFKVYKMKTERVTEDGVSKIMYAWTELNSLDGRMLFVGRGCSRSYEVADYVESGLDEGIYFADDESFYDPAMLLRGVNDRNYPCDANGKWSQWRIHKVERCFPFLGPSKSSPPVWLLP